MVKSRGTEIAIGDRSPGCTLTQWLYEELRFAILSGRLKRGARIPATRSIAVQYGISRRTGAAHIPGNTNAIYLWDTTLVPTGRNYLWDVLCCGGRKCSV